MFKKFLAFAFLAFASSACFAVDGSLQTWVPAPTPHTFATGYVPGTDRAMLGIPAEVMPDVPIPDHFDWREVGAGITEIKDQGSCGSCWAFASVGVTEAVFKLTGLPSNLSEQYLVSCDKQFWGCNGGDQAYRLFVNPGTVSAEQMPYTATNGSCKSNLTYGEKLVSWHYVAGDDGGAGSGVPPAMDIARAIYLYGPVSVAVAADNKFMSYRSGIYSTNSSSAINHLVVLVGYDLPGGYWIMRNSWGKGWGENGYMRIKFGVNKIGDEAAFIKARLTPSPGPAPELPTCTLLAAPAVVKPGESTTLKITGANGATAAFIEGQAVDVNGGELVVTPIADTVYRAKVTSPKGEGVCEAAVDVVLPCEPQAKADAGPDKTIKWRPFRKESALVGTPALAGHSYVIQSARTGAKWNAAQVDVTPSGRGEWKYTVTATTKCGTASDEMTVFVK